MSCFDSEKTVRDARNNLLLMVDDKIQWTGQQEHFKKLFLSSFHDGIVLVRTTKLFSDTTLNHDVTIMTI